MFEFFHGRRTMRILEELFSLATDCNDPSVRLRATQEILNRVLGKPTETMQLEVNEGFKQIIVGDLKGNGKGEKIPNKS